MTKTFFAIDSNWYCPTLSIVQALTRLDKNSVSSRSVVFMVFYSRKISKDDTLFFVIILKNLPNNKNGRKLVRCLGINGQ